MKKDKIDPIYLESEAIKKQIVQSFTEGDVTATRRYIDQQLNLAEGIKNNWNYNNLLHQCYSFLGLIELEEGDIESAKHYLIKAGSVGRSPQLNSFGPNMLLAEKLAMAGEKETVIQYLDRCKKFWFLAFFNRKLHKWKRQIKAGLVPDFGFHKIVQLGPL